jgi:predicted short-subunit dehydrogenase-like oxidoreductase (DUF2520 family)
MQVTIIGSGNVATVMGRVLVGKGHNVDKVYSRQPDHALALATELGAEGVTDLSLLDSSADIYLLAVTDDALAEVASNLSLKNKLVIHTAGSVSKEILKTASSNYGVLWPMKMIRKTMTTLTPVTMVVDGSSETVTRQLEQLATEFSPIITRAADEPRMKMHLLASFTSNFTNHLYHLAADYCAAENIDFSLFYPIIEDTARQIQSQHPALQQAGPAFRGDSETLKKHLALLGKYPQAKSIYEALSKSISTSFPAANKADL